jgi:hypothetical protein
MGARLSNRSLSLASRSCAALMMRASSSIESLSSQAGHALTPSRSVLAAPNLRKRAILSRQERRRLQSSMAEIFNNISEHSRYDIGSVFGQYFPNENAIIIAVSDMGLGISCKCKKARVG